MSALTTTDVQRLRDILTSGDRGGFYYTYAQMIRDVSPTAYNQVMTQAQITTYGGLWGGAAIIGNAMAQNQAGLNTFGEPLYNTTLDQFSFDIATRLFEAIELDVGRSNGTGILTADEIQELDYSVWLEKEMGHLFPGNFQRLMIDATPDITNVQVQINSGAAGFSPLEAEQRVTFPIETAIVGLPGLDYTRSISRYGLSQVTAVFEDGTDIYFARQLINERLQAVRNQLPDGVEPQLGPVATGLGEIFMYVVEVEPGARKPDGSAWTSEDLRTVQD